ncbi:MAG: PIN domain-containing protein [Acidobacteria bacterium]|nr:PIN domain-containing protein [Acidobacteriota bacterium]MBV9148062.1 PIN domain-containing protein [Acidobacteriota bacterium]MBV9437305.1 PIN domain-containing protein [Acidobacteriota bacterium]
MAIVIDADVVIQGERGSFDFHRWLVSRPSEQFAIAAITVAELWHGVERAIGSQRRVRERYLESFFAAIRILPYDVQTAFEHARIWADLDSRGKMIGHYDLIVAATALEQRADLATFNKRHFSQIAGLRIVVPTLQRP